MDSEKVSTLSSNKEEKSIRYFLRSRGKAPFAEGLGRKRRYKAKKRKEKKTNCAENNLISKHLSQSTKKILKKSKLNSLVKSKNALKNHKETIIKKYTSLQSTPRFEMEHLKPVKVKSIDIVDRNYNNNGEVYGQYDFSKLARPPLHSNLHTSYANGSEDKKSKTQSFEFNEFTINKQEKIENFYECSYNEPRNSFQNS